MVLKAVVTVTKNILNASRMPVDTTRVNELLTTAQVRNGVLTEISRNMNTEVAQSNTISAQARHLKNVLSDVQKDAETYNQEFLDHLHNGEKPGFMKLRGVSSLQDWILFYFYIMYAILSICMLILAISVTRYKVYAAVIVIAYSLMIGTMMTAVIIRFA